MDSRLKTANWGSRRLADSLTAAAFVLALAPGFGCSPGASEAAEAPRACWDLNENGLCNVDVEDMDGNGRCSSSDCHHAGLGADDFPVEFLQLFPSHTPLQGAGHGPERHAPLALCWDLNDNGACDRDTEDLSGDGACSKSDCCTPGSLGREEPGRAMSITY